MHSIGYSLISNGTVFGGHATSMSAPHVTGIVALMLEVYPNLDYAQVVDILQSTARSDGFTGTGLPDNWFGAGKVDALAAVQAANAPGPQQVIPVDPGTNGLIAYYAMENSVSDSSGNGLNGTIYGNPNFVAEHDGMTLDLDGNGDYVDCGYDPLFNVTTNEITVSAWVTIRSIANQWAAIAAKGEYAWRLGNTSWDPRFHFGITIWNAPDTASLDGVTAVGYDEWHHAAGVFDGSNIMVYLDGALDGSEPTTEPIGVNTEPMLIGNNPYDLNRWWDGLIDEVKVYDFALSEGELRYLAGFQPATKPIAVQNFSFELPGYFVGSFDDVPGWSSDTITADSGVESAMPATDGIWTAFLKGADPSIWQLTSHVIGANDIIELKVDAADNWAATVLQISLYYDDNGARVTIASLDAKVSGNVLQEFALTLNAANAPNAVGKRLGVELNNTSADGGSFVQMDNVRLSLIH